MVFSLRRWPAFYRILVLTTMALVIVVPGIVALAIWITGDFG